MLTITVSGAQGEGKTVLARRVYGGLLKDAKLKATKTVIYLHEGEVPYTRPKYQKYSGILITTELQ